MNDVNAAALDAAWHAHTDRQVSRYDAGLLDAYTPPSEGYLVASATPAVRRG